MTVLAASRLITPSQRNLIAAYGSGETHRLSASDGSLSSAFTVGRAFVDSRAVDASHVRLHVVEDGDHRASRS